MTIKESDNPPICHPNNVLSLETENELLWYAVYTKPQQEKALAYELCRRNINYYLPLTKQKQPNNKRIRFSIKPLFKSWLFFRGNIVQRHEIFKTNRIVRIIDIPNQEVTIKELSIINESINNRKVSIYTASIHKGKKVRVIDGPLVGIEGIILENKNDRSLIIQVTSIQQNIRVNIDSDKVELI